MSTESQKLEGKVAIITGAGQGIGLAIARRYAREGAKVVLADINAERVEAAADAIASEGYDALAVPTDVASSDEVDRLFDRTLETFDDVDIMVNNAAYTADAIRHVLEADEAWWDRMIDVNLKGHFLCSLRAARIMAPKRSGVIIATSSGGATKSHRGMVPYDASKGGIEALARALALDLAPYGIRVVTLVPGLIAPNRTDVPQELLDATDATVPLQRAGLPEDLAGPAVFLASDDAAYVTGAKLVVDGGVLAQQRSPQVERFPVSSFPVVPEREAA
ncbi:SDR family NAD(P)-dependent oxidoreductase [Conexibacter woesei]|uniref:Short-chain dehydrogenase/reductase SDR n=1 Tax=Conexibacter woesei (strain DSM 14684 / CCUG 47730 / CIP 108061 / JCM 11494 / NBRC 100937 / ID131577) TaxID=469383 RepID=D3F3M9_CONWI|nr:glucose 1-dehydrogenase [Conexibacter woesei]ADB52394.1 short-chain dehydrogenase/reductase SDR [Conexibacter woesei DSM 14684]